jgi:invasin D
MEILKFASARISLSASDAVVRDVPQPPEMPNELHAGFSLTQVLERSVKTLNRNLDNLLKCQPNATKMVEELLAGGTAESLITDFVEQVQAKRIRSQMWTQQLRQCGAVMIHCVQTLPMEQRQRLDDLQSFILFDLKEKHPPPPEIADEFDQKISSSNDFFDKLLELIYLIKNGYLAGYEHIIKAYSDFFADFNAEVTAKLQEWIQGGSDGKEVNLNAGEIRFALLDLINKYSVAPAGVLFPAPGMPGASKEEAEKWLEALGLPASCLKDNGDGTFSVMMDLTPLRIMMDSLPSGEWWITWDTARFQAWQTGFRAQEESMKNMLQSLTQKYSNANSYHDNFNKTLSSHLNQYADMLKAMLNF